MYFFICNNILVHEEINNQTQRIKRQKENVKQARVSWSLSGFILLTLLLLSGDVHLNPGPMIPGLNVPVALAMNCTPQEPKDECLASVLQSSLDFAHLGSGQTATTAGLNVPVALVADCTPQQPKDECLTSVLQSNLDFIHLNPGPTTASLNVPVALAADCTPQQLKGASLTSVLQSNLDFVHLGPGPMATTVGLNVAVALAADGAPKQPKGECFADVLQSNPDCVHRKTRLVKASLSIPVTQGLVDGISHQAALKDRHE